MQSPNNCSGLQVSLQTLPLGWLKSLLMPGYRDQWQITALDFKLHWKQCSGKAASTLSICWLAWSTRDTITMSDELDRHGCDLTSISENIDTTSVAGQIVFRMLAVMAEFERDQVCERTRVALAHMKSPGAPCGPSPVRPRTYR